MTISKAVYVVFAALGIAAAIASAFMLAAIGANVIVCALTRLEC